MVSGLPTRSQANSLPLSEASFDIIAELFDAIFQYSRAKGGDLTLLFMLARWSDAAGISRPVDFETLRNHCRISRSALRRRLARLVATQELEIGQGSAAGTYRIIAVSRAQKAVAHA